MKEQMMSWLDILVTATQSAANKVIWFVPNLVVALLLLLIGTVAGRWIGTFVEKVLGKMKITEFTANLHLDRYLEPFGLKSIQQLLGKLVHFFIFLIALVAAADTLHLTQVTTLLNTVLLFIPKAVVALLILIVGLGAARLVDGLLQGELVRRIPALKTLLRFIIVTFALLAAMDQFEVSPRLVEILFAGLVFSIALAAGLAFGLGGKDAAKQVLDQLKKKD